MIKDSEVPLPMQSKAVVPEGVSFDGVTDYMSRSTDLVGNTDSKTFTFSCCVYVETTGNATNYIFVSYDGTYGGIKTYINSRSDFIVQAYNSAGINILTINSNLNTGLYDNTFINITLSVDLSSPQNRYAYINDVLLPDTIFTTYTNDTIDVTKVYQNIGNSQANTAYNFKGRLSNLFIDYTYRDLSIEANRRLFITADGKPASGLETLNPILYLPMKDKATAHINLGTGGDFIQQGLLETADRGANQDNCVASSFDGVDDYLSSNILTAGVTSFTFNIIARIDILSENNLLNFGAANSAHNLLNITIEQQDLSMTIRDTGGVFVATVYSSLDKVNLTRMTSISACIDFLNPSNNYLVINGKPVAVTTTDISNGTLDLSAVKIGNNTYNSLAFLDGSLGELYFDTNYIDLATNNPFWNSDINKPIPVRTAMSNLGSNPLICMPIEASNPTKNYGSGGDFTLNGGGLVGARGMSEYIARSIYSPALDNSKLINSSIPNISSKSFSCVFFVQNTNNVNAEGLISNDGYSNSIRTQSSTSNTVDMTFVNSAGTVILNWEWAGALLGSNWMPVFIAIDLSKPQSSNYIRINSLGGSSAGNFYTFTDDFISFKNNWAVLGFESSNTSSNETLGNLYFTTDYIDFSQEANRNLFVNQLGYPRDLKPLIADGTIPTPLIYLPFDDTTNLGKNLGTGGDFAVNGTVTAGADFTI